MRMVICQGRTKREIEGDFSLCMNTDDLRELRARLGHELDVRMQGVIKQNVGWFAISGEMQDACGLTPSSWKDPPTASCAAAPVPLLLNCPACGMRHVDEGHWATKHHHTHACQECGHVWRPAVVDTVGVQFLPGFKNT